MKGNHDANFMIMSVAVCVCVCVCLSVCLYVAAEVQPHAASDTLSVAAGLRASIFVVEHRRARPTAAVVDTE